jgi:predicted RecB family nuclease
MAPSLLKGYFHKEVFGLAVQQSLPEAQDVSILDRIEGVGIPDLIRVFMSDGIPFLQVGDIKDSPVPYYSQKWQTAFYALLLKESIRLRLLPVDVEVSDTGFLLLRGEDPEKPGSAPALHLFDLAPFLSAFPALFQSIGEVLLRGPAGASCHLQGCSTTCPYFEICYREALQVEDIQFIPRLSRGELLKMRQLGLTSMEEAKRWFDDKETL